MSAIHPFHRVVAATARQPRPAPLPLRAPARMPAYARAALAAPATVRAAAAPRASGLERAAAAPGRRLRRGGTGGSAEPVELR